jgi:hypothetical protein
VDGRIWAPIFLDKLTPMNRRKFEKTFDHADDAICSTDNVTLCNANAIKINCVCFDTEITEYWLPMVSK